MAISAPFLVANAGWFEGDVYEVGSVPQFGAGGEDRGDHVDGHPLHAEGDAAGFEECRREQRGDPEFRGMRVAGESYMVMV